MHDFKTNEFFSKNPWRLSSALFRRITYLSRIHKNIEYLQMRKGHKRVLKKVNGFDMIIETEDNGISRDLFLYGAREILSTDLFLKEKILKQGDTALDIGANIGYYSLLESRAVGKEGRVYAVEPINKNFKILEKNIKLNNCTNVKEYNFAFGDRNGKTYMDVSKNYNWHRVSCNQHEKNYINDKRFEDSIVGKVRVNIKTVDSFLKKKRPPDLVRMDVEGYEYKIIKGMRRTLKNNSLKLLIEIHPKLMSVKQINSLFNTIKKNDFKIESAIVDPSIDFLGINQNILKKLLKNPFSFWLFGGGYLNTDIGAVKEIIINQKVCPHVLFSKKIGRA